MLKQQLDAYFEQHTDQMIEDIAKLVRINSVSAPATDSAPFGEGTEKALSCALDIAEQYGFAVHNFENYVGTVNMNDHPTELGILTHLDVVPEGTGWTVPPYECTRKDGNIYGRGTADDKGPAIAALYAMKAVKDLGIKLNKNVRLIMGTDEEIGSRDIKYYFQKEPAPPCVFSPDSDYPVTNIEKGSLRGTMTASWESETASPRVVYLQSGSAINIVPQAAKATVSGLCEAQANSIALQVQQKTGVLFTLSQQQGDLCIEAKGDSAHAAMPYLGNNALTALLELLCALPLADCASTQRIHGLSEAFPHGDWRGQAAGIAQEDEISHELTISLDVMNLDEKGFTAKFDSRTPVCATEENSKRVLMNFLADRGITMEDRPMNPPHVVDEKSPFVQELLKCYEQYTGEKGYCIAIGGGTYVHHIEGGVAFGCSMPKTENRMHGPDEFAVIEELVISAKIFAQVIVDLCAE